MTDNITLPREVAKLAFDHIEWYIENERGGRFAEVKEAAEALRTALAAPCLEVTVDPRLTPDEAAAISSALAAPRQKPEPVAYFDLQKQVFFWAKPTMIDVPMTVALNPLPLYAAPPTAAPEPVRYPEKRPALEVYNEIAATDDPGSPLERLRFFCSLAMRPQDWLDVEPFFDSLREPVRHPGYIIGNHWLETAYERLCAGEAEDAILEDYELVREPRLRDLRRDAERYRWGVENARWIRHEHEAYVAIPVAVDADLSCTPMRTAAIDAAMDASTAPTAAAADASTAPEAKP
jgi:hypothetical protein